MAWEREGIDMEGLAERLRKARKDRGLSQARLAALLEISPRVRSAPGFTTAGSVASRHRGWTRLSGWRKS